MELDRLRGRRTEPRAFAQTSAAMARYGARLLTRLEKLNPNRRALSAVARPARTHRIGKFHLIGMVDQF